MFTGQFLLLLPLPGAGRLEISWRKIPLSAPAKVTWVERFSPATGALQGYYRELQAQVFVCFTCTPHLTNTFSPAQWLNPKQLFLRNKRALNSAEPQCRKVLGKGGATVCSAASVGCRARPGANTNERCQVKGDISYLLELGFGRKRKYTEHNCVSQTE